MEGLIMECPYKRVLKCEDCNGKVETFLDGDNCSSREFFIDMARACPNCHRGIMNPTIHYTMACDKCAYERPIQEKDLQ